MTHSFIKILSCSIFIAEMYNKKVLAMLLKDYARTKVTQSQFILILMLTSCYRENNIYRNDSLYKILVAYMEMYENSISRALIFKS
jgi:hypothetical protein